MHFYFFGFLLFDILQGDPLEPRRLLRSNLIQKRLFFVADLFRISPMIQPSQLLLDGCSCSSSKLWCRYWHLAFLLFVAPVPLESQSCRVQVDPLDA